ncbi:MAG: hypothetical protein QNI98_06860 [Woeseiaceae bacterium]|nr:hypothetical protein [Woeseiaceae bacterium]
MKKPDIANKAKDRAATRSLLPLVAIGGGLAAAPASALELGDLTVQSNLGQPLRASIAYALAPNEMLSDTCVSVSPGRSTSGLPGLGSNTIRITERAILISGTSAIREPMLATRVTINCPYTPNLSREYMLLVDPAGVELTPAAASAPTAAAPIEAAPAPQTTPVQRARAVDNTPIGQSTRYQVKIGETLGDIAGRIENRTMKLWPAVDLIFQMNPDAFIDSDPNKLKAGAWLTIPSLDGSTAPVVAADVPAPAETTAAPVVEPAATEASAYEPPVVEATAEATPVETVATETLVGATADLKPGDVILADDNPFVERTGEPTSTVIIPDTELEGPQTTSESPNVPTAIISTGSRSESTSLLAWLIGGGLAVIIGLLLFGRRIRERFGSTPIAPVAAHPQRRATDHTEELVAVADETIEEEVYDLEDDSPTEENLTLDAELVMGTGFDDSSDMEVAEDIGYPSPTEVDIELPFEPEPVVDVETDIIPPVRAEIESILESEVLPDDEDYDMSVIMDATQMPQPEDVTKHDLKAVKVGASDDTLVTDNYTISKEVDYDILEQDYEEELSATQALNQEIARAAAELADNLDEPEDDDVTSEMPMASVTELDVTASLEQPEDDTAEMEQSHDPSETGAVTVNMTADDKTAEMPAAGNDDTVEMDVEGGKVDTKAI